MRVPQFFIFLLAIFVLLPSEGRGGCPVSESYEGIPVRLTITTAYLTDKLSFFADVFPQFWKTHTVNKDDVKNGINRVTVKKGLPQLGKYRFAENQYANQAVGNRESFAYTYLTAAARPNNVVFVALRDFNSVKSIAPLSQIFALPFISLLPLHNWYSEGWKMPWLLTPHTGQYLKGTAAVDLITFSVDENRVKHVMAFKEEIGSEEWNRFYMEKTGTTSVHVSDVILTFDTAERVGKDVAKGSAPDVYLVDCPLIMFEIVYPFLIDSGILDSQSVLVFFHDIQEIQYWPGLKDLLKVNAAVFSFNECFGDKETCREDLEDFRDASSYDALADDLYHLYRNALFRGRGVFESCRFYGNETYLVKCGKEEERGTYKPIEIIIQNEGSYLLEMLQTECYNGSVGNVALSEAAHDNCIDDSRVSFLIVQLNSSWTDETGQFQSNWSVVGKWTLNERLKMKDGATVYPTTERNTTIDQSLRIVFPISPPFVYESANGTYAGIDIDVVERIREVVGFTNVTFELWTEQVSGTYSDMIEAVGKGDKWDLGVGALTFSTSRALTSNFTQFYFTSSLSIMVKRSVSNDSSSVMWRFMQPFQWSVWLTLLGMFLLSMLVMKWLGLIGDYVGGLFLSFATFFFMNENRLVQMGNPFGRIYISTLCFVVLVIVSSYTANMVSFLTSDPLTTSSDITGLTSLRGRNVSARQYTSNWRQLTVAGMRKLVPVEGVDEALKLLRSGSVAAYIADSPYLEWISRTECDVAILPEKIFEQQYAYAVNERFYRQFGDKIDEAILDAITNRIVVNSYDDHIQGLPSSCQEVSSTTEALEVSNVGGVFIISAVAAFLCLLLKGVLHWKNQSQKKARNAVNPFNRNGRQNGKMPQVLIS